MIKNYFFDFDKTLADSGATSISATKEAFKAMGFIVPETDVILGYMGIPAETSFKKMAKESLSEVQIKRLTDTFRTIYKKVEVTSTKLYPNIVSMLTSLKKANKNIFIVSSKKTDAVERNLNNLKIISFFQDIVGFDKVKNYKPAPDEILLLLRKYDLVKDESLMIGDAKYDIQMGKAAGIKTCGALWGAFDVSGLANERPMYLIDQPMELVTLE